LVEDTLWTGEIVHVTYSDDLLSATGMTAEELSAELALVLYQREQLSIGQAARLAGMDRINFQRLMATRGICLTLDVDDLEQDIATLRSLGRL
jgi:predicted HTH domain antitoxin